MFPVECKELRINHLTPLLVVNMPYTCWFLWWANYINNCNWRLHFQFGVAFRRVLLREIYFEGPNRVWRALKTSYQGHTVMPSQKHQPYVFSWNTWLGFQLAWVVGCKATPSSNHSSSSSQLKSHPCISGEYVQLVFLVTEVVGVLGVAPLSILNTYA